MSDDLFHLVYGFSCAAFWVLAHAYFGIKVWLLQRSRSTSLSQRDSDEMAERARRASLYNQRFTRERQRLDGKSQGRVSNITASPAPRNGLIAQQVETLENPWVAPP